MSSSSTDRPSSKTTLVQYRHDHQQKTISEQMSVKTDSIKSSSTPPTVYDDDVELLEITRADSQSSQRLLGIADAPRSPSNEAMSQDTIDSYDLKQDDSNAKSEGSQDLKDSPSDSDDDQKLLTVVIDPICAGEADGKCTLNSGDHRKVTSHIFGRNKRQTHQIPQGCWLRYCRKHYQRQKYRRPSDWFETQLLLVDAQLDRLEEWGGVIDWTIQLRKKEREAVDEELKYEAVHGCLPSGPLSRERFLLRYLGKNKTFAEVREVVNIINEECDRTKNNELPSFEFLPRIDERRNPRPRRGIARRGARAPVQRAATTPTTFRLATDGSGQLTKIETKPRQTPAGGHIHSKAPALTKKRSSSTLDGEDTAETSSRAAKKAKPTFRAVNKQTSPPSEEDYKRRIGDDIQDLNKDSVEPVEIAGKEIVVLDSREAPRPVKRHHRAYSM
ncbi:MAG: hypothetical protein Q9209_000953 [Squamulea sp. 1 TL-2023]